MRIGIYSRLLTPFVETVAYFLSRAEDISVTVITSRSEEAPVLGGHPAGLSRLKQMERVEVVSRDSEAMPLDRLYFSVPAKNAFRDSSFWQWFRAAGERGIFRDDCDLHISTVIKRELMLLPYYPFVDYMVVEGAKLPGIPRVLVKHICQYPPSIHPQFFGRTHLFEASFSPEKAGEKRAFRVSFAGNREPEKRTKCLEKARERLSSSRDCAFIHHFPPGCLSPSGKKGKNILWVEYGMEGEERGLPPEVYLDALRNSDFCVCAPGWGGWTHRVVEALLQGAIPVLDNEKIYQFGLMDNENCIVVRNGDWGDAMERVLSMDVADIRRMRVNIAALRESYLLPEAAAARLRRLMRVEGTVIAEDKGRHGRRRVK